MNKPNVIWKPFPGSQTKFLSCPVWECLLAGNRGGGKRLKSLEKVATPTGLRRLNELVLGELVYSRNGKAYPVTGIFPQGKKRIYKMTLQDGRTIESGDEHLWVVLPSHGKEKVITTEQMLNAGITYGEGAHKGYNYRIPNCDPLQFKKRTLPLDPYILGCLISEGTLTQITPRLATANKFILKYFKDYFPEFKIERVEKAPDRVNHTIVDLNKAGDYFPGVPKRSNSSNRNRLNEAIVFLKLNVTCKNKFIPKIYKTSSIEQRMDLLKGLMDTDGSIGKKGHAEFVSASKQLVNDVAWVCRSLGIRCRLALDKREGRVHKIRDSIVTQGVIYRLYINTTKILAKDPEKIKRAELKKETNSQKYVGVVDIEKTNKFVDMTCISVASPDHTFITKDFIVTHNTDVLIMDYLQGVGQGYGADYKGLLLREATTELGDVVSKCKKWIPLIFPTAKYNKKSKLWTFQDGESLWLNYARVEEDYDLYHGHSYTICATSRIKCHDGYKIAKDVKIGDFVQTLQGPKKITNVLRHKKPGVKVSVLNEDSDLIGQQHQGLIHPVLTPNAGWQRIGLSCLFQISERSEVGSSLIKEVSQFLSGIHQEIFLVLHSSSAFSSISLNTPKWYSCLYQIFHQFVCLLAPFLSSEVSPLYTPQEILSVFQKKKVLEIFGKEFLHERPEFLRLLLYCAALIDFVFQIQRNYVHLLLSNLFGISLSSFLPKIQKYQMSPQLLFEKCAGLLQELSTFVLNPHSHMLNDTFANALFEKHITPDYQDGSLVCSCPYDAPLLQVLTSDQVQLPLSPCGAVCGVTSNNILDFSYSNPYSFENHSTILLPFSERMTSCAFSVSALSTPIEMIDFEVQDEHHYITAIDSIDNDDSQQQNNLQKENHGSRHKFNKQYHIVNQNCWIGWEELTNHPLPNLYLKMMSCSRSSNPDIPIKYRATCNPSGSGHCVPFGEVLTPTGWKDIKKVQLNDPVFTVDRLGHMIESKVFQIHKSYYEGEMINIEKRGLSITCTPEHKLPKIGGIVGSRNQKFTLLEFDNLPNDAYILRSCEFSGISPTGKFKVPEYDLHNLKKSSVQQPKTCQWKYFAELLGWFLSEGGTQSHQSSFSIAKSKNAFPKQHAQINTLLINIGFKFKADELGFVIYDQDWFQFFAKFGLYDEQKYIPREYKNWDKKLLRILFCSLIDGDGTWCFGKESGEYYTISKRLAADVCEIALKLGYIIGTRENFNKYKRNLHTIRFKRTSCGCSVVVTGNYRYNGKNQNPKRSNDVTRTKFKGNIYCIGVLNTHTFIIRQNRSVWISGNSWVKKRFIDAVPVGKILRENLKVAYPDETGKTIKKTIQVARTHVRSFTSENKALMEADPLYMAKIHSLTQDNEMLRKAWIDGSWNLVMGGFFTDVWDPKIHVLEPFSIPYTWRLQRSFDWGSSKPWAVTYGFETNGEQPDIPGIPYIPKGSVIISNEIYGWNGNVNEGDGATSQEIAERVISVDDSLFTEYGIRCYPGPADTQIWEVRDGSSIANNLVSHGCSWIRAYKGPGSRVAGWALIRQMLGAAKRREPEKPHLYFFTPAQHHIRTLPLMQRDKKKPEDIFTFSEDHCFVYDTEIITGKGAQKIGDLVGTSGKVLSINSEFVNFKNCRRTRKDSKLVEITFADGHSVICTPDHKFLTIKGFISGEKLIPNIFCIVGKLENDLDHLDLLKDNISYLSVDAFSEKLTLVKKGQNFVIKVEKIKSLKNTQDVFCLEAEGTHTFALKNGVIVSNCMDSLRYLLTKKMTRLKRRKIGM